MTTEELKEIRPRLTVCPPCQLRQGQAGEVIMRGPPLGMVFLKEPVSGAALPFSFRRLSARRDAKCGAQTLSVPS